MGRRSEFSVIKLEGRWVSIIVDLIMINEIPIIALTREGFKVGATRKIERTKRGDISYISFVYSTNANYAGFIKKFL